MFNMNDYLLMVDNEMAEHTELRYGQTLFNVLYNLQPDVANEIRGTRVDPFYANEDDAINDFFAYLYSKGVTNE